MLAFILLILILGLLIFVHEFGHYITAKKTGAYVYEFALGMGPKLFSFKRKEKTGDPTIYSLRLFPIGGFCAIAGEVDDSDDGGVKLKKEEFMCNKPYWQRCLILIAGVLMNFITGFVILFISALIFGATEQKSIVGQAPEGYPIYDAGIREGDRILEINGKSAKNWDRITLLLNLKHKGDTYTFKVEKPDGSIKEYEVKPLVNKDENGNETKTFGVGQDPTRNKGFVSSLEYAFSKTFSVIGQMCSIIGNLVVGNLSLNSLSGPVGVYGVVDDAANAGIESLLYITAYLSLNLGFVNLLPFPAVDGGRVLFLIIEALRKKKMNPNIENGLNAIGFILLMLLMVVITIKDIFNLF